MFSAVVVSDSIDQTSLGALRDYLRAGGAVLCSSKVYTQLSGQENITTFLRYLCEEPNSILSDIGLIDLYCVCQLPKNANDIWTNKGRFSIFVGEYHGGSIIVLPFDAGNLILDERTATKSFYSSSKRFPFERVSLISKGGIRKLVSRSLEILHHRRGLPYAHKWYYPAEDQIIFVFRIDTDYAGRNDVESLYNLALHYKMPFTWFADVKSQEGLLPLYRDMQGHEIGIHCYNHQRYRNADVAIQDIRKAIDLFRTHGLVARSYAAPYGYWNDHTAQAIESFGFEYSSEFSYDYDNLPSHPVIQGKQLNTLQIPVHPISIGSLRRLSYSEREMMSYFQGVMESKLSAREPLIFYHHPKNNHHHVLESIFNFIQAHHVKPTRMIDVASWWKLRQSAQINIELENSKLKVTAGASDSNVFLRISRGDDMEGFAPIQSIIHLENLQWKPRPKPLPLPEDIFHIRRFNPWIPFIHLEDVLFRIFKK